MQAPGRAIQQRRERAGLSQSALARKAKVGRVTLNRLEAGTQAPTLETLTRIAKALGVRLRDLVGG
jgi:transcriptional regulator with XRE-family HTH domain